MKTLINIENEDDIPKKNENPKKVSLFNKVFIVQVESEI